MSDIYMTPQSEGFAERFTKGQKPDPTFLKNKKTEFKKPLGLMIEKRQRTLEDSKRGRRLSRRELESMLDTYYAKEHDTAPQAPKQRQNPIHTSHQHARIAGGRMVRNLALAASLALFLGFGLGLYSLSNQGGETQMGQKFNQTLADLWQSILPTTAFAKSKEAKPLVAAKPKPVKTASLVVADARGSIQAGIPLKLSIKTDTNAALLSVKIMNVPGDAVLTAGERRKDGVWVLRPGELKDVALVMSSDRTTPLHLAVELVEAKTGELLSPVRELKVAISPPKSFKIGGLLETR